MYTNILGAAANWKAQNYKDILSPQDLMTFMLFDIMVMSLVALIMDNLSEIFCLIQFKGSKRKNLVSDSTIIIVSNVKD